MKREDHKKFDGVSGVYKITHVSGDYYIGASCNVGIRLIQHLRGRELKIQQLLHQENLEDFTFELLEEVPREDLPEREDYWIARLNPSLNQDLDSRGKPGFSYKHSEEAKAKMSKAKEGWKGNESTWKKGHEPWNKGGHHSEESRRKMSESQKGKIPYKRTEEILKKQSEAQKQRPKYKWLFPDGAVKILSIQHASRFYLNRGIQLENLGLCEL